MPRQLNLIFEDMNLGCILKKFTREDFYGKKTQERRDSESKALDSVYVTPDGLHMIKSTKGHYVNIKGEYVDKKDIKQVSIEGKDLEIYESMFKSGIILNHSIPIIDLFLIDVESTYVVQSEGSDFMIFYQALENQYKNGNIYRFDYAYYGTHHPQTGVFIPKDGEIIVLVGRSSEPEFLNQEQLELLAEIEDDDETEFEAW